jgi:ribonuclease VapC
MIVDASALLSIYLAEDDSQVFWDRINSSASKRMSAATYLEAGVVAMGRNHQKGLEVIRAMVEELAIEICDVTAEQARIAQEAYLRYGKGLDPAGLNFGDCFVYALARVRREPVLCKGREFAKTDIVVVA